MGCGDRRGLRDRPPRGTAPLSWSLPPRLSAWYLVAGADEVGARPIGFDLGGERGVVARTSAGLAALGARCPHMGADLGAGEIDGDRIRCPLHGLRFGADGRCDRDGVRPARTWACAEGSGAVFVHPSSPSSPVPGPLRFADLRWAPARAERVENRWEALMVNAFDLHHLQVVHRREVVGAPVFDRPEPDRLRMSYVTRVIGRGASDRLTGALAPDGLSISLTCVGGPVMVVEADLGRTRTAAVIGLVPDGAATWVRLSVGVPGGVLGSARARVARWLYRTFLRRDVDPLRGATLNPRSTLPEDEPVQRLLEFLESRPAA